MVSQYREIPLVLIFVLLVIVVSIVVPGFVIVFGLFLFKYYCVNCSLTNFLLVKFTQFIK